MNTECLHNFLDNDKIIDLLIQHGAEKNSFDKNGQTPLNNAASNGLVRNGVILIEKGADVNTLDKKRQTPLYFAAQNGMTSKRIIS